MYAYLPGRFMYAYVILQVYHHCCFKQQQFYPTPLPLSNKSIVYHLSRLFFGEESRLKHV
jgi:hypothetical protein